MPPLLNSKKLGQKECTVGADFDFPVPEIPKSPRKRVTLRARS